jgi:hypothetical protein
MNGKQLEILYTTSYNEKKSIHIVNLPNCYSDYFICYIGLDSMIHLDYAMNEKEFKNLVAYHEQNTEVFSLYQVERLKR